CLKPESFRGMAETSDTNREGLDLLRVGGAMTAPDVDAWFVREVLPLEAALLKFLRRIRRDRTDVEDLCHDVYVRVYEAAQREIPDPVRPFLFTVARNLLLNRARHENVVAIEAVADLDSLGVALDEPGPDRNVIARQELHRFQFALDPLPPRVRQVALMRKTKASRGRKSPPASASPPPQSPNISPPAWMRSPISSWAKPSTRTQSHERHDHARNPRNRREMARTPRRQRLDGGKPDRTGGLACPVARAQNRLYACRSRLAARRSPGRLARPCGGATFVCLEIRHT